MEQIAIIQNKIYEIRGQKVMLDRDLAQMYGVTTSNLNKAVKRNFKRFPADFMFQLTPDEFLIFQNGTSSWGGNRKLPYAFTEQGLAMLSGILNSDIAINVNIAIMRAFVAIRHALPATPADKVAELQAEITGLKEYIEEVFTDYNDINDDTRMQLELINETLAELKSEKAEHNKPRNPVGYKPPTE
ncbi:MAG: ORF6N domain-containing protein [Bacteroidales bacterium]